MRRVHRHRSSTWTGLKAIVKIDEQADDAHRAGRTAARRSLAELRKKKLQFLLNIEIGNITLGSAACCQTKDALDGVELGQLNSYVTAIKWVSPSGTSRKRPTSKNPRAAAVHPGQLRTRRHRLRGDLQDQAARDRQVRLPRPRGGELTDAIIAQAIASNQAMVMWTVDDDIVIQTAQRCNRAEARVAGQCAALRLELPRGLRRARIREHLSGDSASPGGWPGDLRSASIAC